MVTGLQTRLARGHPARVAGRIAAVGLLVAGCATALQPLRASDPGQSSAGGEEARAELGGVKLAVRADGWRSWPERYGHLLTPLEVRLVNDGPTPISVRLAHYTLEREGQRARPALDDVDLPRLLDQVPPDQDLLWWAAARGSRAPRARGLYPYAWDGLGSAGDVSRPAPGHGPDPRPYPSGVLAAGQSASFMLFFDVPANKEEAFTLVVSLAAEGEVPLGVVRLSFRRAGR